MCDVSGVEITLLTKHGGPLSKRISLGPDGRIRSDGSACVMAEGGASRLEVASVHELAALIAAMAPNEAVALGALRDGLPDTVNVVTKDRLARANGTAAPDVVARTADSIIYREGRPAFALLDFDTKGMPPEVAARIETAGGFWAALNSVVTALTTIARVERRSTSAGLRRTDTGETLPGSDGMHVYVPVKVGSDIERFLRALHDRCWLAGFGWYLVGTGGQLLDRSIVDRMVGGPERLVFEGPPVVEPPLTQDADTRRPIATGGDTFDTLADCGPLSIIEQSRLNALRAAAAQPLAAERAAARDIFIQRQAQVIAERSGISLERARRVAEQHCDGALLPNVVLPFDAVELAGTTVADVLADPARFVGETLADPLEGLEYGRNKARIMRGADGWPWIHSFAHGRTIYRLLYDAPAIETITAATADENVAEKFVELAVRADITTGEYEHLRDRIAARAHIGKRTLDRMLKQAKTTAERQRQADARQARLAERKDTRAQVPVPPDDAPWLPQMAILNQALGGSKAAEPPARDLEGHVVEIRTRRTLALHTLTATGANDGDDKDTRLPAPEQPLVTRLNEAALAEMIERHVDYVDPQGRSVHLPTAFVRHFLVRADDALPAMIGVATLPIVLPSGEILAGNGLDRGRGIAFRVPRELLNLLPTRADCTAARIAEAIRFLVEEWLADVGTDGEGKCTLIAAAASVVERHALPARPAFIVTAGQRAAGKTTAVNMIATATTGRPAAAAAWSPSEEERRKAILAYLAEGLPLLVWDNIPRGSAISCASIEKALTAETYSDRVLGQSASRTVAATTIQLATGNNIAPRGDLASRTLSVRLTVARADPENREFRHADPIAWTEAHRGQILAALYAVLLGNPRLGRENPEPARTRFKIWWNVVGSAVESAWAAYAASHGTAETPPVIDFAKMFDTAEAEDEEAGGLAYVLEELEKLFPDGFEARDLAKYLGPDETRAEDAVRLLAGLEQASGKAPKTFSIRAMSWMLRAIVGAPAIVGERTLMLERRGQRNRAAFYAVRQVGAAAV